MDISGEIHQESNIKFNINGKTFKYKLDDDFIMEKCYVTHIDSYKEYLYYIKYLKYDKKNYSFFTSNYLDKPAITKYYMFTNTINYIQFYENGHISNRNGPALIGYNEDGSFQGNIYYFEGRKFDSKSEYEKHIKLLNLT